MTVRIFFQDRVLPLVLASASPRRRSLLSRAGFSFEVHPSGVAEAEDPAMDPEKMVSHNARIKARAVGKLFPGSLCVGADTTVALNGEVFNKPVDLAEAANMLRKLSGREHRVLTGVCFVYPEGGVERLFVEVSRVVFRDLSEDLIERYLARVDPLDKAGAYAVQDHGEWIIDRIHGSKENVMGFPVDKFVEFIGDSGFKLAFEGENR